MTAAAVVLLLAIGLAHPAPYMLALQQRSAFFQPQCQGASVVALPENLSTLSLRDEPTLLGSLGHYLFRRRQPAAPPSSPELWGP